MPSASKVLQTQAMERLGIRQASTQSIPSQEHWHLHMKLSLLLTGRCSSIRNRTLTNDYNSSSWALCPPIPDLPVHTTVTPWSVLRAPFTGRRKES